MPSGQNDEGWMPPPGASPEARDGQNWNGGPPWSAGPWRGGPPWRYGDDQRRRSHPRRARWFPVIVSLVLQIPALAITLHLNPNWLSFAAVALTFVASFALLAIGKHPGPTVVAIAILSTPALALAGGPPLDLFPLAFAVVLGVLRGARYWVWITLAAFALVGPLLAFVVTDSSRSLVRPLITALFLCLLVGLGEFLRGRRERFREVSKAVAARQQSAAEAERVRIARELHDVLAHSLSQISVQAGVGLHLFDSQPDRAKESLAAIKDTSGRALEEVRGVLGFLRSADEPAARAPEPDLDRLTSLVASVEHEGFSVTLDNRLPRDLAAATQLAIYRIVQESLTNAARHSGASRVSVELRPDADEYLILVTDNGRGAAATMESGRGIVGMRERADLLGGSLEVHSPPAGGFMVEARIPLHRSSDPRNGVPA